MGGIRSLAVVAAFAGTIGDYVHAVRVIKDTNGGPERIIPGESSARQLQLVQASGQKGSHDDKHGNPAESAKKDGQPTSVNDKGEFEKKFLQLKEELREASKGKEYDCVTGGYKNVDHPLCIETATGVIF